jgi:hypothetical protein
MKAKIRILAGITAALYVLVGASVWEGAAAVSDGADFPEKGYFVATASFPKNTVIDITNLENDKTIQAVVSASLDAPGLLAVLSRETADKIGLKKNAIGRIRISQPSDSVAFSRFTDGLSAVGTPFVDSDAAEKTTGDTAEEESVFVSDLGGVSDTGVNTERDAAAEEKTETLYIVELDDSPDVSTLAVPPESESLSGSFSGEDDIPEIAAVETPPAEAAFGETAPAEPALAETPPAEAAFAETPRPVPPGEELYDYSLVPAEERPPVEAPLYIIDPDSIIPGISGGESFRPEDEGYVSILPVTPDEVPSINVSPLFSAPVISSLESGSYYVQLGAYSRLETIESEMARIDSSYPVALFNAGSAEKPVYRILLGPLNLGESGAVLKRFKSVGYKDAFVRKGQSTTSP